MPLPRDLFAAQCGANIRTTRIPEAIRRSEPDGRHAGAKGAMAHLGGLSERDARAEGVSFALSAGPGAE
jgi:hypothetical protein